MLYLSDLLIFTLIGLVPAVLLLFLYTKKKRTWMLVLAGMLFLFSLYTFSSMLLVDSDEKMVFGDENSEYYVYCGIYPRLVRWGTEELSSTVIGSAPGDVEEFCDGRLVKVEGRNSLFHGSPMLRFKGDSKGLDKLYFPVVYLNKIESLTNPPIYHKEELNMRKDLGLGEDFTIGLFERFPEDVVKINGTSYVIAKKIDGKWVEVYSGQDIIDCVALDKYEINRNLFYCEDIEQLQKELDARRDAAK